MIDAWGQNQVLAGSQRCIDVGQRARWRGDEEGADRQRGAGISAANTSAGPACARRICQEAGREDPEVAAAVYIKKGLFTDNRGCRENGIRINRIIRRRRAGDAGEDHIPDAVYPTADRTVACIPLRLGAGVDLPGNRRIGEESAGCVTAVGIGQLQRAIDLHAAEGSTLRNAPLKRVSAAALRGIGGRVDGHVLHRTPKKAGYRDLRATSRAPIRPGAEIRGDEAVDDHVAGVLAEAGNRRVVADRGLHSVCARHEQHRVAIRAELASGWIGVVRASSDVVERRLNIRFRRAGRNDCYVGSEDRVGILGESLSAPGEKCSQHQAQNQRDTEFQTLSKIRLRDVILHPIASLQSQKSGAPNGVRGHAWGIRETLYKTKQRGAPLWTRIIERLALNEQGRFQ